jgi:hypothetical protein
VSKILDSSVSDFDIRISVLPGDIAEYLADRAIK